MPDTMRCRTHSSSLLDVRAFRHSLWPKRNEEMGVAFYARAVSTSPLQVATISSTERNGRTKKQNSLVSRGLHI